MERGQGGEVHPMKFRLLIANQEASLPPDFKISFQKNSPFLSDQQEGELSFPFRLPNSQENQAIFDFAENLQAGSANKRSYDADFWAEGDILLAGTFELRSMGNQYVGNLVVPLGNVPEAFWTRKLTELDFGSETFDTTEVTSNLYSVEMPDLPKLLDIGDAVAFWFLRNGTSLGSITIDLTTYKPRTTTEEMLGMLVGQLQDNFPSPNYVSALKNTFVVGLDADSTDTYGIQVVLPARLGSTTFFNVNFYPLTQIVYDSPADFADDAIGNNPDDNNYVFPLFEDENFYPKDSNKMWTGLVNYADEDGHFTANTATKPTKYTLVPQVFFTWFLQKLGELMGYQVSGSILTNYSLKRLVVFNLQSLDKLAPGTKFPFNIWSDTITFAKHLPPITAQEALNAMRNAMGIIFDFNVFTKQLVIRLRSEVMANTTKRDWTDRVGKVYEKEGQDPVYYQLVSELDGGDELAKDTDPTFDSYPPKATVAASANKYTQISTKLSTISVATENAQIPLSYEVVNGLLTVTAFTTQVVRKPGRVKQAGVSPLYDQDKNTYAFRLAFFDETTRQLENQRDTPFIPADQRYSMAWGGNNGLYNKFWKDYLSFVSNAYEVKFEVVMSLQEIAQFNFFERVHILGLDYFVKQINYELSATSDKIQAQWICWRA